MADQQMQYFAMMTQANAHVLAQLQKLVLIMQPFIAILFLKEDASTPPQKPESLPNTISVTTTPDPKSYQHAHDNLCNYPVTSETIPTIAMTLVKLPLSSGVTSTPVPPWPPPMQGMIYPNPSLLWHDTPTTKLLPNPAAGTYQIMQHITNSTWISPVSHPTSCPSFSITKHRNHYKAPIRFKHPFFTDRRTKTKDFMRPR